MSTYDLEKLTDLALDQLARALEQERTNRVRKAKEPKWTDAQRETAERLACPACHAEWNDPENPPITLVEAQFNVRAPSVTEGGDFYPGDSVDTDYPDESLADRIPEFRDHLRCDACKHEWEFPEGIEITYW